MKQLYFLVALFTIFLTSNAQDKKWDVEKFQGTTKNFTLNTDEGTWMNLDVSPDGQEIVFDLLGDIYT
ncbi:MAG: hypothetical protein EOP55_21555, partial [Sphingobacteriales bacterium]